MNKIVTADSVKVNNNKISSVYIGNVVEIITPNYVSSNLNKFRKLNKTEYVDCTTGEIRRYRQPRSRNNNIQGVQRSLAKLRRIINSNFVGDRSELFLTLTYATVMTDGNQLYKDFKNFITALRRHYLVEYIAIAEPQQSGSWHMHVLLKSLVSKNLFIPLELLSKLWRHGFCHIEKLPFATNFGAYFAVRVTDLYDNSNCTDKSNVCKSIIKGRRLQFYPANFKVFRCSKGIKRPEALKMTYGEAKALTKGMQKCFSCSKQIVSVDDNGNEKILNTINYEHFKK